MAQVVVAVNVDGERCDPSDPDCAEVEIRETLADGTERRTYLVRGADPPVEQ